MSTRRAEVARQRRRPTFAADRPRHGASVFRSAAFPSLVVPADLLRFRRETRVKTLLSEEELRAGVARMAARIQADYEGRSLTILGVMTGSVVLLADLIRRLSLPLRVGVVQASSYRGETSRGRLVIHAELMPDVTDRDVLLVDDIFDTGRTLVGLLAHLESHGPRSVRSAVLLLKEGRQEVAYRPDYVGFVIPDRFVVGYGLDYRDECRHLPYVATLEPSEIADPAV